MICDVSIIIRYIINATVLFYASSFIGRGFHGVNSNHNKNNSSNRINGVGDGIDRQVSSISYMQE